MGLIDKMRNKIRSFLRIEPPNINQITIQQRLDYNSNSAKNRIWYRGDSQELSELYSQLDVSPTVFWKAGCTKGMEIRKIHTGLPRRIVDTLTNILVNDFNKITVDNKNTVLQDLWDSIYEENGGDELLKKCLKNIMLVGDGAFKISFDPAISAENPIIEFYAGEYVEYTRKRGRIVEVIFITEYADKGRKYTLKENYGKGYIEYHLFDQSGNEVQTNSILQTSWIDGNIVFDKKTMLAVPCVFGESELFTGRGESIYDGKTDCFDALDEAWSQWMDALRAGRTKQYIPNCLLPFDANTGTPIKPNAFDNRFIAIGDDMTERANNQIVTENPDISHESYLNTYITALDLCLQGIISPSTLGIDVKKLDNAEAQREKEKTTLYTRGNFVQLLEKIMPELVRSAICGYQIWHNQNLEKPNVDISFGEYANPSFEATVETVSKAKQGGIMSIESCVDELYGDSKDDKWKLAEVERLKAEQGISETDEPTVNDELDGFKAGFVNE